MTWSQELKSRIKSNVALCRHTTFRIGGPAQFYTEPQDTRELIAILKEARRLRIPYYIIGNGSNILVRDRGVRGIVIKLCRPYFKKINFKANTVEAGAGLGVNQLLDKIRDRGLGGCEFLAGIPATLGAAVVMNAGVKDAWIGECVKEVKILDNHLRIRTLKSNQLRFNYRKSNLEKYIVLGVKLGLKKRPKREIMQRIKNFLKYKKLTQDMSGFSAGCIFKNPRGESAGRLIDLCGLKGKRIGDASVSFKHANFIINRGRAKAKDVLSLMNYIRKRVREKFHIDLEPEIKIW
ncbi:MAG: UDP-N-acetylmuramate dehydrogenase [Candidatus Omnitrophica bacterium]|nr:UDP-N-acetylmuramate dehydrogenase [Candidatus Omnitrophota bacterium]